MPEIITIDPRHPEQGLINRAVAILRAGGLIAYPTETFYGLGADARIPEAVDRVFSVKGRSFRNPVALIVGDREDIADLATSVPAPSRRLMEAFWPGALTLLFPASPRIIPRLTAGTGTIGIRVSSHPIAAALAKTLASPLTATSANVSGREECTRAAEVREQLGEAIDAIIDGGSTAGGSGSTILDMTTAPPRIIREGAIPAALIYAALAGP